MSLKNKLSHPIDALLKNKMFKMEGTAQDMKKKAFKTGLRLLSLFQNANITFVQTFDIQAVMVLTTHLIFLWEKFISIPSVADLKLIIFPSGSGSYLPGQYGSGSYLLGHYGSGFRSVFSGR